MLLYRVTKWLTPSADTKAAFMGEFTFSEIQTDEAGVEHSVQKTVPWVTVKEIMAAIRAKAGLGEMQ